MKFHVIYQQTSSNAQSPFRVVEQKTGREVGWINRYLDRSVSAAWPTDLRSYAHDLLHFLRWWADRHYTGDIEREASPNRRSWTIFVFRRATTPPAAPPSTSRWRRRTRYAARVPRLRPCQIAPGFQSALSGAAVRWALARPRPALTQLRVKSPNAVMVPLSVEEVARFWSSFRTSRDLAIVGLMFLHGLRSCEVLALNPDDVLLSEAQIRVRGKGKQASLPPAGPRNR